jgi:hypothetical protein
MQCSESASGVFGLKIASDELVERKMFLYIYPTCFTLCHDTGSVTQYSAAQLVTNSSEFYPSL